MKKTYQIKSPHSIKKAINFTVGGKSCVIVFESKNKNGILTYETSDAAIQNAIEDSKYFKGQDETMFFTKITLLKTEGAPPVQNAAVAAVASIPADDGSALKAYDEVTTWEQAKTVLRSEYGVGATSNALKSPEGILAKAAELGISFPQCSIKN